MLDHLTKDEFCTTAIELRRELQNGAQSLFHGRPTERLAVMIAATLAGRDRHSPRELVRTIEMLDELRYRLTNAKV